MRGKRDSARYRETREWVRSLLYDVRAADGTPLVYAAEWAIAYAYAQAHAGSRITVAHLTTEEGQ